MVKSWLARAAWELGWCTGRSRASDHAWLQPPSQLRSIRTALCLINMHCLSSCFHLYLVYSFPYYPPSPPNILSQNNWICSLFTAQLNDPYIWETSLFLNSISFSRNFGIPQVPQRCVGQYATKKRIFKQ